MLAEHLTNAVRYERIVLALLPALRDAYTAAGDPAALLVYLADLRMQHRRRPTFIKTLDVAG